MSEKEKVTDSNRELFWQRMIEARRDSGLSVARFCQKEGISQAAYYYWRKKLCDGVSPANETSSAAFLEVVMPRDNTVALELVLSSGHTLRINPGADNKILSHVLSALRQAGLC